FVVQHAEHVRPVGACLSITSTWDPYQMLLLWSCHRAMPIPVSARARLRFRRTAPGIFFPLSALRLSALPRLRYLAVSWASNPSTAMTAREGTRAEVAVCSVS